MSHCEDPVTCPGGNCIGCKNGQIDCQDVRCAPYCPEKVCALPKSHDENFNIVVTIILLCLMTILFIYWFAYGPGMVEQHSDHARANVIVPQEYIVTQV